MGTSARRRLVANLLNFVLLVISGGFTILLGIVAFHLPSDSGYRAFNAMCMVMFLTIFMAVTSTLMDDHASRRK
jgi:hypothetical protein